MGEIIFPDYIHYTRVESITAEEATQLLARIELLDAPDLNNKVFSEQVTLAVKVLLGAIVRDQIKYSSSDERYVFDNPCGKKSYDLNEIYIKTTDFCSWASQLKYNLPDVLTDLIKNSNNSNTIKSQAIEDTTELEASLKTEVTLETEEDKVTEYLSTKEKAELPNAETIYGVVTSTPTQKKKTKPPEALTEAMEYVYKILRDEGNTEILKPKSIHEFLKRFKEFVEEKGNRNLHPYVVERIMTVNPLDDYDTVKTKERVVTLPGRKPTIEKSKRFNKQNISRRLCDLRKKYPLATSNSYSISPKT